VRTRNGSNLTVKIQENTIYQPLNGIFIKAIDKQPQGSEDDVQHGNEVVGEPLQMIGTVINVTKNGSYCCLLCFVCFC
jgi:hypothetical protein